MNNGRTAMTLALLKGGVLSEEEMAEKEAQQIAEKAAENEKKHQEFLESERKYQEQRERIKKKIIPLPSNHDETVLPAEDRPAAFLFAFRPDAFAHEPFSVGSGRPACRSA